MYLKSNAKVKRNWEMTWEKLVNHQKSKCVMLTSFKKWCGKTSQNGSWDTFLYKNGSWDTFLYKITEYNLHQLCQKFLEYLLNHSTFRNNLIRSLMQESLRFTLETRLTPLRQNLQVLDSQLVACALHHAKVLVLFP